MSEVIKPISSWDRRCLTMGIIMTTLTALTSHVWYLNQKTELMRQIYRLGLTRSTATLALVWLGLMVFLSLLWLFYRRAPWTLGRGTWTVIITTWSMFSVLWLFGRSASFYTWFGYRPPSGGLSGLLPYFFFVAASILTRCVVPIFVMVGIVKRPIQHFGYRLRGGLRGYPTYIALTAVVVLLIMFFAAEQPAFVKKYPWCKRAIVEGGISGWVVLIYITAAFFFFFSGESFWRGFLLFGTYRELGPIALFLMVNIYVFAHFGKPLAETMGAIIAGLVLGGLALKHKTFILGVFCHWIVAVTMDLVALAKRGIVWNW